MNLEDMLPSMQDELIKISAINPEFKRKSKIFAKNLAAFAVGSALGALSAEGLNRAHIKFTGKPISPSVVGMITPALGFAASMAFHHAKGKERTELENVNKDKANGR